MRKDWLDETAVELCELAERLLQALDGDGLLGSTPSETTHQRSNADNGRVDLGVDENKGPPGGMG